MRMNPRYSRVRGLITDEVVPRHADGGIALCHLHQRSVAFAGGFLEYLTKEIARKAQATTVKFCPKCGDTEYYELKTRGVRKCKSCYHQYTPKGLSRWSRGKLPMETYLHAEAIIAANPDVKITHLAKAVGVDFHTAFRMKGMMEASQ